MDLEPMVLYLLRLVCFGLGAVFSLWMLVYGMPASAAYGGILALLVLPGVARGRRTRALGVGLAVLLPLFAWQVSLGEYARATDVIGCTVRCSVGRCPPWCADIPHRRMPGKEPGPLLTLRQRAGVVGLDVLLALGGYALGFPEVAEETLRLLHVDGAVAEAPLAARRGRCAAGAGDDGPVVTDHGDFFLDSRAYREAVARLAREAAGAAPGTALGAERVRASLGGTENGEAYFGCGQKPLTARTALSLYVPDAAVEGIALGGGALEVVGSGGIFYPPAYGFEVTVPTLRGDVVVRLEEAAFCGLQVDGWMRPYRQRWVARVEADDPRIAPEARHRNAPAGVEAAWRRWGCGEQP